MIQKINAFSGLNSTHSAIAFRGVISEPSVTTNDNVSYSHGLEEEVGTRHRIETRRYYPYKDDTAEIINEETKNFKGYKSYKMGLVDCVEEKIVNIEEALPCTAKEAKAFLDRHRIEQQHFVKYIDLFKSILKVR